MDLRPPTTTTRTTSVEEAVRLILDSVARMPTEMLPLATAAGRVLAEAVRAAEDLWPFPRAAMDGIAVRAADIMTARADSPVRLTVAGSIYSGEIWPTVLTAGTAIRIATGTPMPSGADAVIPREQVEWDGDDAVVRAPVPTGRHVFPAGADARVGEELLQPGTLLHGGHIGLLAALGVSVVPAVRRPVVSIFATGDELVPPSAPLKPGQVRESNSYALGAEVTALGAVPRLLDPCPDRLPELETRIRDGLTSDGLVICGGASVGERDLVREALTHVGASMRFSGVAIKPGGPATFWIIGSTPVFSLPGTPGAARVAFEVLVRPAFRAMLGCRDPERPAVRAYLTAPISLPPGRRRFLWATVSTSGPTVQATPLRVQDTATLRSASMANALIDLAAGDADLPAGAEVTVRLLARTDQAAAGRSLPTALGIVGARDAGKTTLIERLIPALRRMGRTASAIKHHVHTEADAEGSDTARYTRAGAVQVALAGPGTAVLRGAASEDFELDRLLQMLDPVDVVFLEGYSQTSYPKVLVQRKGSVPDRPAPAGPIIARVSDEAGNSQMYRAEGPPLFGWDDTEALAAWLVEWATQTRESR